MRAPKTLLLDTNVWLDLYCNERPFAKDSMELVTYARDRNITLAYSSNSLSDVFYLVSRLYKNKARAATGELLERDAHAINELAWGCAENMAELGIPIPCDLPTVWMAMRHKPLCTDLEDNLVLAASMQCNADFLVTNDEKFARKAPVASLSCKDMLSYLKSLDEEAV